MNISIERLYQKKYMPYIFLLITYIPFFIAANQYTIDDTGMFYRVLDNQSLWHYTVTRYMTWSSRNILEIFTVLFCNYIPFPIWKVINLLFYFLLFYSLAELLFSNEQEYTWLLAIGLQFLPVKLFNETGLATISTTYIWPLTLGILSLFPWKSYLTSQQDAPNTKPWQYALSYLFFCIAGNMELYLIMMIIGYILFLYLCKIRSKKWSLPILGYGILLSIELIFFLLCPGNKVRAVSDSISANYYHSSFLQKALRGFFSTMQYCVGNYEFQFFFLCLTTIYLFLFFRRTKLAGKITLIFTCMFSFTLSYLLFPLYFTDLLPNFMQCLFTVDYNCIDFHTIFSCAVECILYLSMVIYLLYFPLKYRAEKKVHTYNSSYIISAILILSLFSRFVMGLSPTLDIDLCRQAILCITGIIIGMLYLLRYYQKDSKYAKKIFIIFAIFSWIRNIILTFYYIS